MTEQPTVILSSCEVAMAWALAKWRVERVERENRGPGHGEQRPATMDTHWPGVLGEMAVANHFGEYYDGGAEQWATADVAGFQVRATPHWDGHLIVYGTDGIDQVCLLVTVRWEDGVTLGRSDTPEAMRELGVECRLVGVLPVAKALSFPKSPAELRPGSPEQFWVPQEWLYPMMHRDCVADWEADRAVADYGITVADGWREGPVPCPRRNPRR